MALRYTTEDLLCLRDSPLCVKPENLPPTDEWMGQPLEQPARNQQQNARGQVGSFEKFRNSVETPLHDQTNRRPGIDRHVSRNSATNPEDIVFGPPRMAFASSGRGTKTSEGDKAPKDGDAQGRFPFRNRNEGEGDRLSVNRGANPLRRRGDGSEQDSDGWTPVKPRKSFGAENAERFQGRMGGNFRDEKPQTKDANANGRTARPFDAFTRERPKEEAAAPARGTAEKNGTEAWHKSKNSEGRVPEKRERIDRAKSWRDREQEPEPSHDQGNSRNADRRWGGGDRRAEREPEWLDEPADPKGEARTQQDFQKWMEDMKKTRTGQSSSNEPSAMAHEPSFDEPPASAPPIPEQGPDKFFMAFGSKTTTEVSSPAEHAEAASRPKPAGKSSRFTSFFQSHEAKTEPATPMAAPPSILGLMGQQPPAHSHGFAPGPSMGPGPGPAPPLAPAVPPQEEEKQAFQQLLAKLQKHSMSATPPGPSPFMAPGGQPNPAVEAAKKAQMPTSPFEALLGGIGGAGRPPPQQPHEIHAPRPQPQSARPEQLLQDLVGHHQRVSSRGSGRPDEGAARNNSNTEFLMNLMRAGSGSTDAQIPKQAPMPKGPERDADFGRDGRGPPRQARPPPPPGFPMDDGDYMTNQPTQILQRPPPPPGLDQMPPNWMGGGGVQLPPLQPPQQQRGPMLPPPGLAGGPGRNPPMPPMFPPNFPPGGMPMPEGMGNMPPRNMGPGPPPPLGFYGQMPPGFMPPGMGGFDGPHGPQSPGGYGPQAPFDNRGMPAPGGRGNNFGRG